MHIIAIDPGSTGAICILAPDGRVEIVDTPIIQVHAGGTKAKPKFKNEPDEPGMLAILRNMKSSVLGCGGTPAVVIEKVNAMPAIPGKDGGMRRTMGATSAFSFGLGYGMWRMACAALGLPYQLVHSVTWKKVVLAGAPKSDGAEAIIAGQLYPDAAQLLRGPKGGIKSGRVDALLIAHWKRLQPAG